MKNKKRRTLALKAEGFVAPLLRPPTRPEMVEELEDLIHTCQTMRKVPGLGGFFNMVTIHRLRAAIRLIRGAADPAARVTRTGKGRR